MRRANADILLSEYIDECRDRPFEWGKHDCLTFANNCIKAQMVDGALDDLVGEYDCPTSALYRLRKRSKELGYNASATIIDALDDRLTSSSGTRLSSPSFPTIPVKGAGSPVICVASTLTKKRLSNSPISLHSCCNEVAL